VFHTSGFADTDNRDRVFSGVKTKTSPDARIGRACV